jgi:soluble epoxide hydrolase / lipid-phosphate phosphatase
VDASAVRKKRVGPAHTTCYLEAGPPGGAVLLLVHGWPGLAVTWRHQIEYFSSLGYRVVAPDMRGYGESSAHQEPSAYRQELIVADMICLLDHLGAEKAIWLGHDWGSPTVWNIAAHFPERCTAVASLAIPFGTIEHGFTGLLPTIDRDRYPEDSHPFGQFDYMAFYEEAPQRATAVFDADPAATVKALFRSGKPSTPAHRAPTATTRRDGGWFGGADSAPDLPLDERVLDESDHAALAEALRRTGFHGPTCYYLNHADNARYAAAALHDGVLSLPVLFVGAAYDQVADLRSPTILAAMRETCTDLEEVVVHAGHWLQLEKPAEVNRAIENWLHDRKLDQQ